MNNTRIQINSIIENQLPSFVRENFPLVEEFLKEYYKSLDSQGRVYDILQNIDKHIKVDTASNIIESTTLISDIGYRSKTITVENTDGFPEYYGLIKIDNEIILYKNKTETTFENCVRGFSGISSYDADNSENLTFEDSFSSSHSANSNILNLSVLFLREYYKKVKKQFLPGFEDRSLYETVNSSLFLKQSKDFYSSKGTDEAFKILFRVLFGSNVDVIKPRDFIIQPSDSKFRVTRDIVVEPINGNPLELKNKTIFQDQQGQITKAFASVTDVESIYRENRTYYILKLDYDFDKDVNVFGSIFGFFTIHPKTKIIEKVSINENTITVDSTVGFPNSGTLIYSGKSGNILITYEDKNLTQFNNCFGITENLDSGSEISLNAYAYGYSSTNDQIRFRVTGVISDISNYGRGKYYEKNDTGKIISIGYNKENDFKANQWLFNVSVNCEVSSITDNGGFNYTIETFDNNNVYDGDKVEIDYFSNSTQSRKKIIFTSSVPDGSIPGKSFQIQSSGETIDKIYSIRKVISKYGDYVSEVSNVYKNISDSSIYITSSSFPNYGNAPISVDDFKIEIENITNDTIEYPNHGFINGDAVLYTFDANVDTLDIETGVYFVKKIDDDNFKLSRSRQNILFGNLISLGSKTLTKNYISLLKFASTDNLPDKITSQKLVKKLSEPTTDGIKYSTTKGTTGIFLNGVELLNYKSDDIIYYGGIEYIDVIGQGSNYDVINPPILEISSGIGTTVPASGYCGVEGSLERIDIIDPGFDYLDNPIININGGGGSGATASVNLFPIDHVIDFDSTSNNSKIKPSNVYNEVGFGTYHKLRTGESIVYSSNEQTEIGGLTSNSSYYVKVIDDYSIQLFKTYSDSIRGENVIDITGYGEGTHTIKSKRKKSAIGSITVTNPGTGYKNKKITVLPVGVNTSSDTIEVFSHPYNSGEILYYDYEGTNIAGLTTGSYYVTKIDNTKFKLSQIGIGTIPKDFYYKTNQYINFETKGNGKHIFNYEPITVSVSGYTGVSTSNQKNFNALLQPIFRGNITSIYLENGSIGYGSSDIINYNKQPEFNFNSGKDAKVLPIISSGKIVEVLVVNGGTDYVSPPDLLIRGFGTGAKLTPVIENGSLKEVKVINGGFNYENKNTIIDVVSPGSNCKLKANIKKWTINNFTRLLLSNKIGLDDGVIYRGINSKYGLQYTHIYTPRNLRKKLFSKSIEEDRIIYRKDYNNDNLSDKYHSPIVGWAYDGNPIYGPYGYASLSNKAIKQIASSYSNPVDDQVGRPDKKIFPAGFFVEDYQYTGNGDLDENNGRFCITPEFPNGTYAYFTTIDTKFSKGGIFDGEKIPKFPYVIGTNYKSKPIDNNFSLSSNQDEFDFNNSYILRNTYPYNTRSKNSFYSFIKNDLSKLDDINSYQIKNSRIESVTRGKIDDIKIVSGGTNYSVGDKINFDNTNTKGTGSIFEVGTIGGKEVNEINLSTITLNDIEIINSSNNSNIIGFSSVPHDLLNNDLVNIDSLSNFENNLQGSFNILTKTNNLILTSGIGDTITEGYVNYLQVTGNLSYPYIRENDIYKIGSEKIKILNVEPESSRIRVLRGYDNSPTSSYSGFTSLIEQSRKFEIEFQLEQTNYVTNKEYYFNPPDSLGIGTVVGYGITVTFSNPGSGATSIVIPERLVYLKNHEIETGTILIYKSNGGTPISVSTDGKNSYQLSDNDQFYAAKISDDFIGISTSRVGLNTFGQYSNSTNTDGILYFHTYGSGEYHSLKTSYQNVLLSNVSKNSVVVSTATTHSLSQDDTVFVNIVSGLTTNYSIKYNDYYRKIIVNEIYFDVSDVSVIDNTITIPLHKFKTGQKIIHNSNSPSGGLIDNKIYYVIKYDENRIKLAESKFNATKKNPEFVKITSSSFGTLSPINPPLDIIKNNKIVFDVSDTSLSVPFGIGRTSAFNINFYKDSSLTDRLFLVDSSGVLKVQRTGIPGVDSFAKIELLADSSFPESFYYSLDPIELDINTDIKKEITIDTEVDFNNFILFKDSAFSGIHKVSGVGTNNFTYIIENSSEVVTYNSSNSIINYETDSKTDKGEIKSFDIKSKGLNYEKLPSISSITSDEGNGAILIPYSDNIGKIKNVNIVDIGYNYSQDNTLSPLVKFPSVIRVEPLSKINTIGITSIGLYYNTSPDLVVIDGFTGKLVDDVVLKFDQDNYNISVLKNSTGFYDVTPKIIPTNNSNGLGISSVFYDTLTKDVTVYLSQQFSSINDFPFVVGDRVIIEGISVTNTSDKGFNSKNYNYELFTIVDTDPNIGGANASIKYSLNDYLIGSGIPGTYDEENSSGTITPEKYFPIFDVKLVKNSFTKGETVKFNGKTGKVLNWDEKNEYLKIETDEEVIITPSGIIEGFSSKSKAFIREVDVFETYYNINSSSIVRNGWINETGFLNNSLQRIHDNDYYQYFSYSLKSEISLENWQESVNSLNHTVGFKKFGDLQVISSPSEFVGIDTNQNEKMSEVVIDLNSKVDVNCTFDYDLVSENYLYPDNQLSSNQIYFNSKIIQDYSESIGNRVLIIDDISKDFNTRLSTTFVTSFNI